MNRLCKTAFLCLQRSNSHSQIKFLLNRLKFKRKYSVKRFSYLSCHSSLLRKGNDFPVKKCSGFHNDSIENSIDEEDDINSLLYYDETLQFQPVRNLLYPNPTDPLLIKLNNCASIQETLNFVKESSQAMQHSHITQAVLVLWDLQKIFLHTYHSNKASGNDADLGVQDYISQLINHPEFLLLLKLVEENCDEFDIESISCLMLYLNKMGLSSKHEVLQLFIPKLSRALKTGMSLTALSRFIVVIFSDMDLGSFLLMQDSMPLILAELEKCESAEDLKLITNCLNYMHHLVTPPIIELYKKKVKEMVDKNILNSEHHRTILKVAMFLSYPEWCESSAILISGIMMLLKNHLHVLNVHDFLLAYEILYKNHEPGELLTEMQRCASRLLMHADEDTSLPTEVNVKLLSCTISFSSSRHRPKYEKVIEKYLKEPLTQSSIVYLLRPLMFIKPSERVCGIFWDNVLESIKSLAMFNDSNALLQLTQKYMNFSSDVHYRHEQFETRIIQWFSEDFEKGIMNMIPYHLSMMAAFIFAYAKNESLINCTIEKLVQNWEQFSQVDCLHIAKGLRIIADITKNPFITTNQIRTIKNVLDKTIYEKLLITEGSNNGNLSLKSCIYRKTFNRELMNELLSTIPEEYLSSNSIRSTVFSLQATNSLLPKVIDNIGSYVVNYRDHLLGFNAERIAYLCYYLGYTPKNSDALFQAITNLIIRDQDRISGLSYIQFGLALCFFNMLPTSFIKQIFNVSFLERLDSELATCYFKDIYPIRVRHSMMQLNRAVCLDYPETNTPWFHQKYIEQLRSRGSKQKHAELYVTSQVKTYLQNVVGNPDYLVQDVFTPYGYHVDFIIHLDANGQLLKPNEAESATKVAVLLFKSNTYTNINVQLKGPYQLKKRHLEILGYKVLAVNLKEWSSLLYGEEKSDYFIKLIWPYGITSEVHSVIER